MREFALAVDHRQQHEAEGGHVGAKETREGETEGGGPGQGQRKLGEGHEADVDHPE